MSDAQDAQLTFWRRAGCITICAATAPTQRLVVPTPRDMAMNILGGFIGMSPMKQRREAAAVARAVRKAWRSRLSAPSPELLADIAHLYAADLILGPHIRAAAGLSVLAIAVEEDEALSWQERGMLDPDFMAAIGRAPVLTVQPAPAPLPD